MSDNTKMQFKKNGSIRVTGTVDFVDAEGNVIESKSDSHFADVVTPRRSHFVMAAIEKPGLLRSN